MRKNKLIAIIKNELKIASKDKLNIFFVYILPTFCVPILTILFSLIMYSISKNELVDTENAKYNIGINFEKDAILEKVLQNQADNFDINIINSNIEDLINKFEAKEIDAYIEKIEKEGQEEYKIYHSDYYIEEDIEYILKQYKIEKILVQNKIDSNELSKIKVSEELISNINIFEYISVSDIIVTGLIIVIFFAIYVMGLSIIAQEKERHTLETLLSFPLSIKEVMLGKYISLVIQALKAAVLCSLSTILTCFVALKFIDIDIISNILKNSFPNLFIFLIILLSVGAILSFLLSYLMIFFTSEADNYKKADYQIFSILIVLMVVLTIKEFVDLKSLYSAFIPFINLYGIIEQLFSGNINLLYYVMSIISSIIYIVFFASIFINDVNIEKILFSKIETQNKVKHIKIKSNEVGIKKTIILLVVGIIISSILSIAVSFNQILSIIITQVSLLLTFAFGYKLSNVKLTSQFSFKKVNWISFLSYLMIFIFIYISSNLITNLIAINLDIDTSTMNYIIDFIRNNKLLSIFVVALLPAVVEEIICRGIIQHNFNKKYNIVLSICVASLLFGIMHMNLFQFIFAFIFGIFLGYIYYDSKNILIPILFHFINNLLGVIINVSEINISANLDWILLMISFVTLLIGLYIIIVKTLKYK